MKPFPYFFLLFLAFSGCLTPSFPIHYDGELPNLEQLKKIYQEKNTPDTSSSVNQIIKEKFIYKFYDVNNQLVIHKSEEGNDEHKIIKISSSYNDDHTDQLEILNTKGDKENVNIVFKYFTIESPQQVLIYSLHLESLEAIKADTIKERYAITDKGFFRKVK